MWNTSGYPNPYTTTKIDTFFKAKISLLPKHNQEQQSTSHIKTTMNNTTK